MSWHPVSIVVVILTIVLGATMLLGAIAPLVLGIDLSPEKSKMLNDLFKSVVSIITLYVGAMIQKNRDKEQQ